MKYRPIHVALIIFFSTFYLWNAEVNLHLRGKTAPFSSPQISLFPLRVWASDFEGNPAENRRIFRNLRVRLIPEKVDQETTSKVVLKRSNLQVLVPTNEQITSGSSVEIKGDGEYFVKEKVTFIEFTDVKQLTTTPQPNNSLSDGLMKQISSLQEFLANTIEQYLPEPHASLLTGILLGLKRSMPEDFYQNLINTGTLHVIAASGFNITILAKVLIGTLGQLFSKRVAILISLVGICLYTLLAGASPAIVRAAIMGSLAFIAQAIGKDYLAKWSLFVTSALMLLMWPSNFESVSFWLSVTATGGILWLAQPLQNGIRGFISRVGSIQQSKFEKIISIITLDLGTTLAAQLGTLPIMVVEFGQFSVFSFLINPLVLWLVPLIMLVGGLKLLFGLIIDVFGYILAIVAWVPLQAFIVIVNWAGEIPFATYSFTPLADKWGLPIMTIVSICYYLMLFRLSKIVNKEAISREKAAVDRN